MMGGDYLAVVALMNLTHRRVYVCVWGIRKGSESN